MLALQIAAGIVLAALVLKFPRQIAKWAAFAAGLFALLAFAAYAISAAGEWTGQDWLAVGVAAVVLVGGALAYGPVSRLQERRKPTVKDGPPPT